MLLKISYNGFYDGGDRHEQQERLEPVDFSGYQKIINVQPRKRRDNKIGQRQRERGQNNVSQSQSTAGQPFFQCLQECCFLTALHKFGCLLKCKDDAGEGIIELLFCYYSWPGSRIVQVYQKMVEVPEDDEREL